MPKLTIDEIEKLMELHPGGVTIKPDGTVEINPSMDAAKLILRAANRILLEQIFDLIQEDSHSWSDRPCPTCRAIGALAGTPFGCYQYQARKQLKAGQ